MESKDVFNATLKLEFAPDFERLVFEDQVVILRAVIGEVINIVNIQGARYGGSSAAVFGLHLRFFRPCWTKRLI